MVNKGVKITSDKVSLQMMSRQRIWSCLYLKARRGYGYWAKPASINSKSKYRML